MSDAFAILTYGSHSGTFGTRDRGHRRPRTFTPAYTATNLTLTVM